MSILDGISKKVTDAAKTAAKKSGELVEITKLNIAINGEEDKIKALCTEIGKSVYKMYQEGAEINPEFIEKCEQINSIEANIASLREKISQLKNSSGETAQPSASGQRFCPSCGTPVPADSKFCQSCGAKL